MPNLLLENFNLGGISDSKFQGPANSLASIVGFDLHSEPGILKVAQKLKKDSGSTIDEFVKSIVPSSDGNTYFFSSESGKIWKRTGAGTYSLEATAAPAAGAANILDAKEHNGFIYYSMESRLGRWTVATGIASRDDDFATFAITNASFHPMREKHQILYIGDGNQLASVDTSDVFAANAFDVRKQFIITSLGETSEDLLIGTKIADTVNGAKIFRWDTFSVSFRNSDLVPEVAINSFLNFDNFTVAQAGVKGNLYVYDGLQLDRFKRIQGDWTDTNQAIVHLNASENFNGIPIFGLSNLSGNPAKQGIYDLGSYASNYPNVLSLPYVISQNKTASIEIGAIEMIGDSFLASWKDGSNFGIDIIDWDNKFSGAFLETRILNFNRDKIKIFMTRIPYRSLPAGTDITLQKSVNYAAFTSVTLETDTIHSLKKTNIHIPDSNVLQLKISTTASGDNAPEIESLSLDF